VTLVGVVAFEVAAVVILHRVGSSGGMAIEWAHLQRWLEVTPAEDAVVALVRLMALGVAYWLAATTGLYVLAKLAGLPLLIRGVGWATLPTVRRVVDGLMATSIVAVSAVSGTATAIAQEAPPATVGAESHAYTPVPADDGAPSHTPSPAGDRVEPTTTTLISDQPAPADAPPSPVTAPTTYVVAAGDNLWRIAERHLAGVMSRPVEELRPAEVHAYWLRVIDANVDELKSGDPDLIFPGEVLTLPTVTEH
jgi:nucleoid-associated protein YgaU